MLNNWPRAINKVSTKSGRKKYTKMFMLSRQVNKIVDVVFVIESLGKVKSRKPNLITREKMKMLKNAHVIIVTVIN